MATENVGAGILNIVTESLYDKPIVVFREYVQNAVDSFMRVMSDEDQRQLVCKIWNRDQNLYFLDNGDGIESDQFKEKMERIAYSQKKRVVDIGYKGIGRLSGISYCEELIFANILSFKEKEYEIYHIDCKKFNQLKNQDEYGEKSFNDLMLEIGTLEQKENNRYWNKVSETISEHKEMFEVRNKGFFVALMNYNCVLSNVIINNKNKKDNIYSQLGWLLPVPFDESLFESDSKELFEELSENDENNIIRAKGFRISFNGEDIKRPITKNMLRDYTCWGDLKYATSVYSFKTDRMVVESSSNDFSGIRMYIDNMLLCDEMELVSSILQYGLSDHTSNELLQTVRSVGVLIYITDKVNIFANARRTFIETTDSDALEFLGYIADFIEKIYKARYALSKYNSAAKDLAMQKDRKNAFRQQAIDALNKLADEKLPTDYLETDEEKEFQNLSDLDQKRAIKKKISKHVNEQIRKYISQLTTYDYEHAYEDFKVWLTGESH